MEKNDRRTEEQKKTHIWAVVATDKFLSGWGMADGGASKCAWAFESLSDAWKAEKWVKSRSDMKRVSVVNLKEYRFRNAAHVSIYVCDKNHVSLK